MSRCCTNERAALQFFDQLAGDHHAIGDDTFRSLAGVFTTAEIVEIAYLCSSFLGGHRLMHTLGVFNDGQPVLAYEPSAIDRSAAPAQTSA